MRILIVTQAVDSADSDLGFFHRWIEEFAKRFERVIVICLKEGQHRLPENVSVYSLGKESGKASRGFYGLPCVWSTSFLPLHLRVSVLRLQKCELSDMVLIRNFSHLLNALLALTTSSL